MTGLVWAKDAAVLLKYRFQARQMAETILLAPQKYEGLYEPIHRLAGRQRSAVRALAEWKVRTDHLYPQTALAQFLTRLCASQIAQKHPERIAQVLLRSIRRAGVTRDGADTLATDPLRVSAYRALDGSAVEEGATLRVISPAWFCNGLIVEHGIAEVLE